ncbi:MAG TPA: MarR family transcriptional regulator, partial [Steroidobacteraceae bacterium]|nr:MarR family transcriptional regulator [Steroidobacteraceae bacterium]
MSRRAVAKPAAAEGRPPSTEEAFAVAPLIGRVRTVLLTALDRELQPYGLAGTQFAVLKNIADETADTAADLCRILHYDTGSMTRILDRLEEKGLISRERSR